MPRDEQIQPPVTIRLSAVSVRTNHGVTEAEREIGQRMEFDLVLELDRCEATATDAIEGTVDYGAVTELLVSTATERSYLTLERLTTVVAERILGAFPTVGAATVRAAKPEPPVPTVMESAAVEVTLVRDGTGS